MLFRSVFVDGTNAASAWYGVHGYWGGADFAYSLYQLSQAAGSGAWESYGSYTLVGTVYWGTMHDFVLSRSGTTLDIYIAPARGQLVKAGTWTVSTNAGMVGIRTATLLSTADTMDAVLYAYRESLTEVP